MHRRDEPMLREVAAGSLLIIANQHPNATVRRYARAAADVAAEHGTERARGWLLGIWYDGGVRVVPNADVAITFHDVVAELQGALGIEVVTRGAVYTPVTD